MDSNIPSIAPPRPQDQKPGDRSQPPANVRQIGHPAGATVDRVRVNLDAVRVAEDVP
jgi:hypothetical protein